MNINSCPTSGSRSWQVSGNSPTEHYYVQQKYISGSYFSYVDLFYIHMNLNQQILCVKSFAYKSWLDSLAASIKILSITGTLYNCM